MTPEQIRIWEERKGSKLRLSNLSVITPKQSWYCNGTH